jgi:hypothetical protein
MMPGPRNFQQTPRRMMITTRRAMIRARKTAPVVDPAIAAVCLFLHIHVQACIDSVRI